MMNELKNLTEFHKLLSTYKLSDTSRMALSQTQLVLLVAPSSSGRNTIIRQLLKTGDYYFVVSDTTRKPRTNDGIPERNGVEYWFRDEESVLEDIRQGKYLEAAVIHDQQVSGISIRELQKATELEKFAVTDAEIAGVRNVMQYKPDTRALFVLPPSFDEWQRRIKHRGQMEAGEYQRRMISAAKEFAAALEEDYYTFIVNDSVEHAAEQINHLVKLDEIDDESQAQGRQLAEQLLINTQALINSF